MKELTKKERRRENLKAEHWLVFHGDPRAPKFRARAVRNDLKLV
jgi:hypothetical protein